MKNIYNKKQEIRGQIKTQLILLSNDKEISKSRIITEKIMGSDFWKNANIVLCFSSMKDEVNTYELLAQGLNQNKTVGLPKIIGDDITFISIKSLEEIKEKNSYGILEPVFDEKKIINPKNSESKCLIIVPGLAFSKDNFRLGRGKGYYDRYLSKHKNHLYSIGVCFDFQILDTLPQEEHDQKVDYVFCD